MINNFESFFNKESDLFSRVADAVYGNKGSAWRVIADATEKTTFNLLKNFQKGE